MRKLIKGEWYEFEGHKDCLLQYNNGEQTKGWWNGGYGVKWHFNGIADIAKPASEKMLKKYGVIKELKEEKKLNFNKMYIVAGITSLIVAIIALFKGDFIDFKLNLILCILFNNLYKDSARGKT